jgi:hypothetical protein
MQAAVSGVTDATGALASQAATDALVGSSHQQIDFSSILGTGAFTTGVRAGLDGTVVLTGSRPVGSGGATEAYLYQGPLNDTAAGTTYILTPSFTGETITTATLYGPDTSIFDPALGIGKVRAVGSYQYAESPSGVLNHGMMYQGPVTGIGGTWRQIDVPTDGVNVVGGIVLGGTVENTILHSTQGDLLVGNYDMAGPGGTLIKANGFIYDIATQQYTLLSLNGSLDNLTSVYGIWQNGIGSTSYTITGGTHVPSDGINEAFLEDYDSATGVFSNLRTYTAFNQPGVVTHFENITAVPGGYDLVATTDSGPAFANVTRNADGSFGSATWVAANLPGTSMMTGNIAFQNVIGGIYNTSASTAGPTTYLGVVDLSHVDAAGGLIMPMGSFDFAYALTVNGSVGDTISGSADAGNVLGGSIGNDTFVGTQDPTQPDTVFTGGGADTITLAPSHAASDRIELYAANGLASAASLAPGAIVAAVSGSIVNAADIPQLGWWGQATARPGGPASDATTNGGIGTGTSRDMSTVANFGAGDTIDISLAAFSNLLRPLGGGSSPPLGTATFSNLVHPGGAVTVASADVLLIGSPTGFANAADLAATLAANPIRFAAPQSGAFNHYVVAYQDLTGSVRIADMDIQASGPFTTTAQGDTLALSDMVQLSGTSLAALQPGNITFLGGNSQEGGGEGDVHMTTFDGLKYNFQALGDFVVTQSVDPAAPWEIQMRTMPLDLSPNTSFTQALGTTVGDHRVTFAVGRDDLVEVDGGADTTLTEGGTQDLAGGTLTRSSSGSWSVRWDSGDVLTVHGTGPYLNWTVTLGGARAPGSVHGLLGSDTGWDKDFQLPDGTVLARPLSEQQMLGLYADAWRVAPGASLLDDPQAPAHAQLVQAMATPTSPAPGAAASEMGSILGQALDPGAGLVPPPDLPRNGI